jgi:hypothetical protein
MAGINPDTITYIEAHGTGTALTSGLGSAPPMEKKKGGRVRLATGPSLTLGVKVRATDVEKLER